jgi:hypothetical protein
MYSENRRRMGVAALALLVSLFFAPMLVAEGQRDPGEAFRERDKSFIVRFIKKIRKIVGGPAVQDEFPVPPRP